MRKIKKYYNRLNYKYKIEKMLIAACILIAYLYTTPKYDAVFIVLGFYLVNKFSSVKIRK